MLANRVREYTTTAGTGDLTLMGAMSGFIRFADAFTVGDQVAYVIEDGDNYEVGTGTLVAAGTLARTTVSETLADGVHTKGLAATPIALSGNARIFNALTADIFESPEKAADIIRELTPGAGVTVEDVLIKAGAVSAGSVAVADTLTVAGALTASGPVTLDNDVVVAGTVTVNGDLITNTSYQVQIGDSVLELNAGLTGAPTADAGLLINRGTSAAKSLLWKEDTDTWLLDDKLAVAGDISAAAATFAGALSVGGTIRAGTSSMASPFIAPANDPTTGLYRVDVGSLGVTLLGAEVMRLDGGGLQMKGTGNVRAGGGTAATPGFCFVGATNMGMSNQGGDLTLSAAGLEGLRVHGFDQSVKASSGLAVGNTTNLSANADFVVQGSRSVKIGGTGPNYYTYFTTDSGTSKGAVGALASSFRLQSLSSYALELFNTQGLGLSIANGTGAATFAGPVALKTSVSVDTTTAGTGTGALLSSTSYDGAASAFTHAIDFADTAGTDGRIAFRHDSVGGDYLGFYVGGITSAENILTLKADKSAIFAGAMTVAGLATLANIKGASTNGLMTVSGSASGITFGANIQLYAEGHATNPSGMAFRANSTPWFEWNTASATAALTGALTVTGYAKNKKRTFLGDTATGQFATTYYPDTATYSIFHVKNDFNRFSIGYGGDAYTSFTEALGITNSGALQVAGAGTFGGLVTALWSEGFKFDTGGSVIKASGSGGNGVGIYGGNSTASPLIVFDYTGLTKLLEVNSGGGLLFPGNLSCTGAKLTFYVNSTPHATFDGATQATNFVGDVSAAAAYLNGALSVSGNVTIANTAPTITFQDTDQATGAETVIDGQNGNLTLDVDRLNNGGSTFSIKKRGTTVLSIGADNSAAFVGNLSAAAGTFSGNIGTPAKLGLGINYAAPSVMLDVDAGNHNTLAFNMRGRGVIGQTDRGAMFNIVNRSTVSNIGLLLEGNSGQTGDLIQVRSLNSATADLFAVSAVGDVKVGGGINAASLPTYADDASAGTGGLVAGDIYKTATGELRIKL